MDRAVSTGNILLEDHSLVTAMLQAAKSWTRQRWRPLGPSKVKSSRSRGIYRRPMCVGSELEQDKKRSIFTSLLCEDWRAIRIFSET